MRRTNYSLIFIFLAAIMVRLFCAAIFYGEIDTEGAEYARIAQNLVAGNGYVGMATEGTQLFFPPLFPLLIAAVSLFSNDVEIAGRSLNLVFGSLLAFPVYYIGHRIFGRGLALGGAALVALHPYLVSISTTTVGCEPTYYTILFTAISSSMLASDKPSFGALSTCGFLYGAAYLVRQEALVYMVVALTHVFVGTVMRDRENVAKMIRRLWLMPICFLVFGGPYIGWLSLETGHLRVEAKSALNIETELRIQNGMSTDEAAFAVAKDGTPLGVWIQPNIDIINSSKASAPQLVTMLVRKSKDVLKNSSAAVASNLAFGSPALFAIAILGLFSRPWQSRVLLDQVHLILLMCLSIFANFFAYTSQPRFYILVLVVFCIWASAGIAVLSEWAVRSASTLGIAGNSEPFVRNAASILAIATIVVPSAAWAGSYFLAARDTRPLRAFASRLTASGDALRVAGSGPFAFHARAREITLPYCDEETALRFLRKKGVTHVVVSEYSLDSRPYLTKWMEEGLPNSQEVMPPISGTAKRVRVFELKPLI